jgi:hypothetical protein
MPVVFKDVKPEKITIEKDGTLFYFQIDEGKRKSARLNFLIDPERDIGKIMIDHFRKALTGWDNLLNEDNDPVPFSIAVRDTLVNCMEVFNEEDVLGVLNPDSKKKDIDREPDIDLRKCISEAVVMHWKPERCEGCDYYPSCQKPGGVCVEIQRAPTPHWNITFTAAVEIYFKAVRLSGRDMNGYPTLDMLDFILKHEDYEIENKERFMHYITEIHMGFLETLKK